MTLVLISHNFTDDITVQSIVSQIRDCKHFEKCYGKRFVNTMLKDSIHLHGKQYTQTLSSGY